MGELCCWSYGRLDEPYARYVKNGEVLVANTTDFDLTEGNEYVVIQAMGDSVTVKNDAGIVDMYTTEYFNFKWN